MKKIIIFTVFTFLLVFAISCGDDRKTDNDSDTETADDDMVLTKICKEPGDGPYELKFTDVTEELGFREKDVLASQIMVADIDGDRWPDIYTTLASKVRQNEAEPSGVFRLLKNVKGQSFEDVTFSSGLFKDSSGTNGIASTYVTFFDMDNDGDNDALNVVYVDKSTLALDGYKDDKTRVYLNNGDGTFTPGPKMDFTVSFFEAFSGIAVFDYNRDGILDMYAGRHYSEYGVLDSCGQDNLYQGKGDGSFIDAASGSGLETEDVTDESLAAAKNNKATWGVAACDVDGDGFQDIMASGYGRSYNMFYRNKGDGTFDDLTLTSNFGSDGNEDYGDDQFFVCYCKYCESCEGNCEVDCETECAESTEEDCIATCENEVKECQDGCLETCDNSWPDKAYCNNAQSAKIDCSSIGASYWNVGFNDQPHRLGGNSAGTLCGDFDGDGDMDLFAIELAHWHIGQASDKSQLLMNDGFPGTPFRRVDETESGITRSRVGSWNDGDLGGTAADFDNDGKLDIFILSSDYDGTKSLLFQQQSDGTFSDKAKDSGSQIARAHGGSLIDIDRDGDYDLLVGISTMRWGSDTSDYSQRPEKQWVTVLRNDTGQDANKVILDLKGTKANRNAIGAKIIVKAGGKQFIREVQGGYGLNGFQNDNLQIIGIGNICDIEEVEIRWPDSEGSVSTFTDVYANYVLEIDQGAGLTHHTVEEYFAKEDGSE